MDKDIQEVQTMEITFKVDKEGKPPNLKGWNGWLYLYLSLLPDASEFTITRENSIFFLYHLNRNKSR